MKQKWKSCEIPDEPPLLGGGGFTIYISTLFVPIVGGWGIYNIYIFIKDQDTLVR